MRLDHSVFESLLENLDFLVYTRNENMLNRILYDLVCV